MDVLPDQVLRDFTAFHDRCEQFLVNATPATDLKPLGRSFHVESWRLVDGTWQMMRETMELVAP